MINKKLWIDISLFFALILAFVIGLVFVNGHDMALRVVHIILGAFFFVLLVLHFLVSGRGWFMAGMRLFRGEKYNKIRFFSIWRRSKHILRGA